MYISHIYVYGYGTLQIFFFLLVDSVSVVSWYQQSVVTEETIGDSP